MDQAVSRLKTHPPAVLVEPVKVVVWERKFFPVPEIIASVNADPAVIRGYVKENIKRGLPQVEPYETQWDKVIALVLGGATLNATFDDLAAKRKDGMPLVTVNGSYKYCVDKGLNPSAMIMLDSREFNNRFVEPLSKDVKYLISSQCHPSVFDKLEGYNAWIWHCEGQDDCKEMLDEQYGKRYKDYFPVMGGATVTLRAVHVMRMLGFHRIEMFGFDSCIMDDHHAYKQPENDKEQIINIVVSGREFKCTPAHYHQAREFVQMIEGTGEHYDLAVHGDGLISHIIKNPKDSLKLREEVT